MRKNMKMADLLGADYRLLTVIYRLGIKMGFGEKTVEETCRESGVNCDTFLLIARVCHRGLRPHDGDDDRRLGH